jgi:gluconolactonase
MSRSAVLILLSAAAILAACGDDGASTGATSSASSGTAGAGTGGSGGSGAAGGAGGTGGSWEGVDPIAGIEQVALVQAGFDFTEGPCWFAGPGVLRFTDIPNSRIHEVDAQGNVTVWREGSGEANGLGIAPDGRLVACEHANRRVTRSAASDMVEVVAETYQGDRFNSPNDVIIRSDGTTYFTDPTYGLGGGQQEIPYQGVFRVAPDGTVSLVSDVFVQPNGIALSADEQTLYVTDSDADELHTFPVSPDGSTGPGQKLLDTSNSPDGMAVDDAGNLYLSTQAGIDVLRPDGAPWGTITVPEQPANCTFGDADRRTLYITARTSLYRVQLNIPGRP